mmetsp:Transcript_3290/g.11529  ORF Transcript_3290/g.11529 Transcript_3290/m.11529 type:complete len:328 (+) Transcript_3290:2946-3929(+)
MGQVATKVPVLVLVHPSAQVDLSREPQRVSGVRLDPRRCRQPLNQLAQHRGGRGLPRENAVNVHPVAALAGPVGGDGGHVPRAVIKVDVPRHVPRVVVHEPAVRVQIRLGHRSLVLVRRIFHDRPQHAVRWHRDVRQEQVDLRRGPREEPILGHLTLGVREDVLEAGGPHLVVGSRSAARPVLVVVLILIKLRSRTSLLFQPQVDGKVTLRTVIHVVESDEALLVVEALQRVREGGVRFAIVREGNPRTRAGSLEVANRGVQTPVEQRKVRHGGTGLDFFEGDFVRLLLLLLRVTETDEGGGQGQGPDQTERAHARHGVSFLYPLLT